MLPTTSSSPIEEQSICIKCGICCDGTLFNKAILHKGEKENVPKKFEKLVESNSKGDYFKLPCIYFDKKCTIYTEKKPCVCSEFRCKLLKDFSKEKISFLDAQNTVEKAIELRNEVIQLYKEYSNNSNEKISFKELFSEIWEINETNINSNNKDKKFDLLMFKSNILEILLIKHFKSSDDFENLIMK